jgi:hypothetical protein
VVENLGRTERGDSLGVGDLIPESGEERGVAGQLLPHHLYRDLAAIARTAQIDRAHAAVTDFGEQVVRADPSRIGRRQPRPDAITRSPPRRANRRAPDQTLTTG